MIQPPARRRRFGSRAGNAMIEFAIGSGILLTAFTSTFQFGFMFYQYNVLVNAVNDGAHFAALQVYNSDTATPASAFTTAVQDMVIYGDPTGTNTTPVVRGLGTSNVSITIGYSGTPSSTFTPTSVTVAITGYTIAGLAGSFQDNGHGNYQQIMGSFTLTGKPTVTYPFQGMYCPDGGC